MTIFVKLDHKGSSVDSLHPRAWLFLLLASVVVWLTSLSPHVYIPTPPRPAPTSQKEKIIRETTSKPGVGGLIDTALSFAGCNETSRRDGSGKGCDLVQDVIDKALPSSATPSDDDDDESHEEVPESSAENGFDVLPVYRADCWCPNQFSESQVTYTEGVCAEAMNRAVRGIQATDTGSVGTIFFLDEDLKLLEPGPKHKKFQRVVEKTTQNPVYKDRSSLLQRCHDLTVGSAPVNLFILSLVLFLPTLLWKSISAGLCRLNVDKTIELIGQSHTLDSESRSRIYEGVARETASVAKNSGKCAAMFIFCKVACCAASLGGLIYTCFWLVPQLQAVTFDLQVLTQISRATFLQDFTFNSCNFTIRQFANKHDYTIHCIFHETVQEGDENRPIGGGAALATAESTVSLYTCMFNMVCAFLVLHFVSNLLGTTGWVARLYCCKQSAEEANYSSDIRLLLCQINSQIGHFARRELISGFREVCDGGEQQKSAGQFEILDTHG